MRFKADFLYPEFPLIKRGKAKHSRSRQPAERSQKFYVKISPAKFQLQRLNFHSNSLSSQTIASLRAKPSGSLFPQLNGPTLRSSYKLTTIRQPLNPVLLPNDASRGTRKNTICQCEEVTNFLFFLPIEMIKSQGH